MGQFEELSVVPWLIAIGSAIAIAAGATTNLVALFLPAAFSWFLQVIVIAIVSIRSGVAPLYALTVPLGLGIMYAMLLDSSIRITTGKGVTWKGRRIYERHGVQPPRLNTALHQKSFSFTPGFSPVERCGHFEKPF